jgi:hypothetical protein
MQDFLSLFLANLIYMVVLNFIKMLQFISLLVLLLIFLYGENDVEALEYA